MSIHTSMDFIRAKARHIIAVLMVLGSYGMTRLPSLSSAERIRLAAEFAFERFELTRPTAPPNRLVRTVHPDMWHIRSWISSVGAGIALYDLDNDGLANDMCWVDTRGNDVIVAPVPGTPLRYAPFVLEPKSVSLDSTIAPMGCLPGDFNGDGRADLLVYYWGRTPIIFLARDGGLPAAEKYTDVTIAGDESWFTNALVMADVDGDGYLDLIVGNYFPDGARVLDGSAIESAHMMRSMSRAYNGGRNRILLWESASEEPLSVRYRDAPLDLSHEELHGWTLALGSADLDGDLLPELLFVNDFGPDRLLRNVSSPGNPDFERVMGRRTLIMPRSKVFGRDSFKGMGAEFADIDGDGILDLHVSNIAAEYALQEGHFAYLGSAAAAHALAHGRAPFVDRSESLGLSRGGWGWDAKLVDFNNSGQGELIQATGFVRGRVNRWPELQELAMGNDDLLHRLGAWPRFAPGDDLSGHQANAFFVRASDGRFYDIAPDVGLGDAQVSRGIAVADVDGDGRVDFAVANQWEPSFFYRNRAPHVGAFLALRLLLPLHASTGVTIVNGWPADITGIPAIGATIDVMGPGGLRRTAQVDGGNGHSGKRSPEIHFGLGDTDPSTELEVRVRWRDRRGQRHDATLRMRGGMHTLVLGTETP